MNRSTVLREWQVAGAVACINAFREKGGAYLAWDPGMGKTLGTLAVAKFLKLQRIVVACPVVAKGVWRREVGKWWPSANVIDVDEMPPIPGAPADPTDWSPDAPTFVLVSYDRLIDPVPSDPAKTRSSAGRGRVWRLVHWKPDLAIFDEAQYIKSPKAKRWRAAQSVAQASTYKLLLSGTPAHSPLDWWAQYHIVDPTNPMWNQSFQKYRDAIMVLTGPNGNWPKRGPDGKPMMKPGARNRLLEAMAPVTHHADASEVNLPEPIEQAVYVPLSAQEAKHYREMAKDFRTALDPDSDAEASIRLTQMLRFSQISAGFVTDTSGTERDLGTSKLDACLELLEEREAQKVVVVCRFKRDIERLSKALAARKVAFDVIGGSTPEIKRPKIEDWFQTVPGGKVLIIQQRAGGVAITLSAANCLIFFTMEPSVISWRQSWGRVWRIGQTGNVQIIYLLGDLGGPGGSQDEAMWLAVKSGASVIEIARRMLNSIREAARA